MPRPWSIVDFVLVILGGFLGAALFAVPGLLSFGGLGELTLVLGLTGQYVGHLAMLWFLSRRKGHPDLGLTVIGTDALYIGVGLLLQLALAILFLPLVNIFFPDGESAQQVGDALAGFETRAARLTAVLVAVVLAPVTEELTFRGVLIKSMEKQSRRTILVVSSLVFAAFHILGLDPAHLLEASAVVLPQLFIVGLILAWVTLRTGRLGPAIFIHAGFNLLAALRYLLPPELFENLG